MDPRPYLMKNKIQNYEWGTREEKAFIPKFLAMDPVGNKPYAELWIGAHPNAPSDVLMGDTWTSLIDLVNDFPREILGVYADVMGIPTKFPFLLKILSIAEPLSIQTHPNRFQAKSLHSQDPINYPDDNHKPEIAIALDSLNAFVGFKDHDQLVDTIKEYPELRVFANHKKQNDLTGLDLSPDESEAFIKEICTSLINSSEKEGYLAELILQIEERIKHTPQTNNETENLFLQLSEKYPGDIGLIFMLLLKIVHIEKGDAIFIRPGVPHAYVSGNIVECMASSDNVVRAGLTPKFKDLKTLANIISYSQSNFYVPTLQVSQNEVVFQTPAKEFTISVIKLNGTANVDLLTQNSPEVLLILDGDLQIKWGDASQQKLQELHQGNSILIPAFLSGYTIISQTSANIVRVRVPQQD